MEQSGYPYINIEATRIFANWRPRVQEIVEEFMKKGGEYYFERIPEVEDLLWGKTNPFARSWDLFCLQGLNTGLFDYPPDYIGNAEAGKIYYDNDLIKTADMLTIHSIFAAWWRQGHYDPDGGFALLARSLYKGSLVAMLDRLGELVAAFDAEISLLAVAAD